MRHGRIWASVLFVQVPMRSPPYRVLLLLALALTLALVQRARARFFHSNNSRYCDHVLIRVRSVHSHSHLGYVRTIPMRPESIPGCRGVVRFVSVRSVHSHARLLWLRDPGRHLQ